MNTPLYNELKKHAEQNPVSFHMPGHKSGRGFSEDFIKNMIGIDLTELADTDNLHAPAAEGAIIRAQRLAAEAFGAQETRFLVNGSTCGIYAAIMATCNKGDSVIVSRDCHKSVFAAINFIEAEPVYILPEYDERAEICTTLERETIRAAIESNPEAKAVIITRPTYYGYCCDLYGIAELAEMYGMFLIVDEAHGAHLNFSSMLPDSAIKLGAHLCVQSAHKTLPALTQTAYLHINSSRVDLKRVDYYLRLFQTSSPSYILMASLDIARAIMQESGGLLINELIHTIQKFKCQVSGLKHFNTLKPDSFMKNREEYTDRNSVTSSNSYGYCSNFDDTRVVITITNKRISGYYIDRILREEYGIWVEMADQRNIVCIASVCSSERDFNILAEALVEIDEAVDKSKLYNTGEAFDSNAKQPAKEVARVLSLPEVVFKPYEVLNKKIKTINIKECEGEVAAEMLIPYPPGIPLVMPGEKLTIQIVRYFSDVINKGGIVMGIDKTGNINVISMG